ncbi:hypothetical protein PspLS_01825 [Pyricularia sp. CBS 133598]|nr:hypothetical protein PspLS_01825 [Pyricularia sp. CBS 133598]
MPSLLLTWLLLLIGICLAAEFRVHDRTFKPDYVLVATAQNITINCQTRYSVVFNGTSPGPPLTFHENQTTWVRVYNRIKDQNVTVHWHGLSQRTAPFSDGTPLVSQWPVAADNFFDYEIRPDLGSAGTYFYHSHVEFQAVTAHGALIVEDAGKPPYEYDEDIVVGLGEHYPKTDRQILDGLLAKPFRWSGEPEAILFAGHSGNKSFSEGRDESCKPDLIKIKPDKTYRMRFIGGTAMSLVVMAFEGHDMTIIEADGSYTRPAKTDRLQVGSGQRFSILLRTKTVQEVASTNKRNFWIQYETRGRPTNVTGWALLQYEMPGLAEATLPATLPSKPIATIPDDPSTWMEFTLQPLQDSVRQKFPKLSEVTRTIYIDVKQVVPEGGLVNGTVTGSIEWAARFKANMQKAKDSAIGSSFDQHVVGGYRFLMRFYSPGDEIYIFGFSRGAYIARFLAEMLDYVGLLSHGNEEMVAFAWRAFAQWQCRRGAGGEAEHDEAEPYTDQKAQIDAEPDEKKKAKLRKDMRNVRKAMDKDRAKVDELYTFLKGFRETFSRPVRRIRFLGLFDTVNSVPRFETAWMERHGSKFPYTARTSAKVIRHAVSIDERRAKFRQDLIYQSRSEDNEDKKGGRLEQKLHHMRDKYRCHHNKLRHVPDPRSSLDGEADPPRGRRVSQQLDEEHKNEQERRLSPGLSLDQPERYRIRSRSRSRSLAPSSRHADLANIPDASDVEDGFDSEDETDQDIDEVWFSGGHGDVGGGWSVRPGEGNASHVPLAWMVREAMRAGLSFDMEKVISMGCAGSNCQSPPRPQRVPNIRVNSIPQSSITLTDTETAVGHGEHHTAPIHDSLAFNGGLTHMATLSWRLMEWLPFRRMDLQPDGSWQPIRWPLPRGETRDMPADARIHGSVIKRMQADENYRPGNLIVGGGGRGLRTAPKEYGIGEWVCVGDEGDEIGEVWVKKLA